MNYELNTKEEMMLSKLKIAFIDNYVNLNYIQDYLIDGQTIQGNFIVSENEALPFKDQMSNGLSHATLCCKEFLENTTSPCDLYFLNIWEDKDMGNANINSLLSALSWCLDNEIKLINLSLGTPSISDGIQLFDIVDQLIEKNTVLVAAHSNYQKLTFPAAYQGVIGVKAQENQHEKKGFIYHEDSLDKIEVSCYIENSSIEYKGKHYMVGCDNSLATPVMTAKICSHLNKVGNGSLEGVLSELKEMSLNEVPNHFSQMYEQYFKDEIQIPVIGILSADEKSSFSDDLIHKILSEFKTYDYEGICLSVWKETDLSKQSLKLASSNMYNTMDQLRFYTHYCSVDYILVEMSEDLAVEEIGMNEIDIIICSKSLVKFKEIEEDKLLYFSKDERFDLFFNQLYQRLSE